jgi:two-component sensor histidine kinase
VAQIAQRPVRFHIEGEETDFLPVRIAPSEAVSLALVLNELIFNAVKHAPLGGPATTVGLCTDGTSARIVIRNAVTSPPTFDIAGGVCLGTGLRLVLSLLPELGVRLSFEPDTPGLLDTILQLTAPALVSRREAIPAETPPPGAVPSMASPARFDAMGDVT